MTERQTPDLLSGLRPTAIPADPPKEPGAYRTISEVSAELGVPQHVLRFWESRFGQIRPLKRGGGRRYYRNEDVATIRRIKSLLHEQGLTIRGAQKLLRDEKLGKPVAADLAPALTPTLGMEARRQLEQLLTELKYLRDMLRRPR